MRFVEPIFGLPINFYIFYESGIFTKSPDRWTIGMISLFVLGSAIYVQGGALHTASVTFKKCLQTINDTIDDDGETANLFDDLYFYTRTVWQHAVSHYIYATGLVIMQMAQLGAYKDHVAPNLGIPKMTKFILVLSAVVYALLIIGVITQFPSGTIVGTIYLVLYGLATVGNVSFSTCSVLSSCKRFCSYCHTSVCMQSVIAVICRLLAVPIFVAMCLVTLCILIGGYLYSLHRANAEERVLTFGRRPVLHYFLLSYVFATVFLIAWLIYAGGFKSRKETEANNI